MLNLFRKLKLSQLNEKIEIMQIQLNSNKKLGNVGKKYAFIKPIYCFYCEEYNDKNVHICEKEDCYIQYDPYNLNNMNVGNSLTNL